MKNGILRAALLGIVASASFSLTQAASLAAASYPAPTTAMNTCTVNPVKAASRNAAAPDADPTQTDRFMFVGP